MKIKLFLSRILNLRKICTFLLLKTSEFWPEEIYLKAFFFVSVGYRLNLNNPQTYNEKLQWLKLYNRKHEYTFMVDKHKVKDYVSTKIGSKYIIPTIGVWDDVNDINWDILPQEFVLKTTNGGGGYGVIICRDKNTINKDDVKNKLNKSLKLSIYSLYKEWPYKNVHHKIIAEVLLKETGLVAPIDYKLLCFDGRVKLIEYHKGRYSDHHTQDFYDTNWNKTTITQGAYGDFSKENVSRPLLLDEMISLSEKLANDIPHCRIDWYIVNNKLYFGEITFFDGSGFCPFDKYEDDLLLGSWITLPSKTKN